MPVKKYTDLALKKASPALFFNLPELKYPERLNAVEVVLEGAREAGWLDRVVYYADGGSYTYDAVRHSVQCSARALRRMGVDRGDALWHLVCASFGTVSCYAYQRVSRGTVSA